MAMQRYAANGERLVQPVYLNDGMLRLLGICQDTLPKGFVGFNVTTGLAVVKLAIDKPAKDIRIGKLLRRANEDFWSAKKVTEVGANAKKIMLLAQTELLFTETSEEAIEVYKYGPKSCMKGCNSVGVYATEDVAVAYIKIDDEIVARAVVCKNESIGLSYSSVYGKDRAVGSLYSTVIEGLLEEQGYAKGDLEGCRVLHIRDGECDSLIRMPYIDGNMKADLPSRYDKYIVLSEYADYGCQDSEGYLQVKSCDSCGDYEDTTYSEHTDQELCDSCYEDQHVVIDGDTYHKNDDCVQELEDGEFVLEEDACFVDYRDEYHRKEDCSFNTYTEEYILKEDID